MDGIRHPSDGIVTVERCFEWSRLEKEVMTSAYERVLPAVRSGSTDHLETDHEPARDAFTKLDRERPRYATGA